MAWNVWVIATRSTIPLSLDEQVIDREIRHEKHPGEDDVFLLAFDSGRVLQVDEAVYRAVAQSDRLQKATFAETLTIDRAGENEGVIALSYSPDMMRMAMVMCLAGISVVLLVLLVAFREGAFIQPSQQVES